jgi:uncharacterized protein YjbI with pentapeptide repeats
MNEERYWSLRPHFLVMLLLGFLALLLLTILPAFGQEPSKTETQKPWTGKLKDGRVITRADLDRILQAHALSLRSKGKEGKTADLSGAGLEKADLSGAWLNGANLSRAELEQADLHGAFLTEANLSRAGLEKADLSGAWLNWANLSRAKLLGSDLSGTFLRGANLSGAGLIRGDLFDPRLRSADLSKAVLSDANLSGAKLYKANLSGAELNGAVLTGADLEMANLSGAVFQPKPGTVSDVTLLVNIRGLTSLRYENSPHGLVELRETYKKAGLREPERQVTYALNHNRREKLWEKGGFLGKVESLFNLVCFEWPCQYGMNPGRPLEILGLGLFLFTPFYLLALRSRSRETGIWLVLPPDRIISGGSKVRPFKLTGHTPFRPLPPGRWHRLKARLRRGLRRVRLAFYFSLLSAFNLGWRELNVGNWISRLQKNEYHLRATGWVRTMAGVQSLLSVYLLALWVLSYFGRPFD